MIATEKLGIFLADLRSSGFVVGVLEHQRVLDLLIQLDVTGTMPQRSDRLCNMLASILCRSAEQQILFRRRFLTYFGERGSFGAGGLAAPDPLLPEKQSDSEPGLWELLTTAEREMIKRLALVFATAFLLSVILPHVFIFIGLLTPSIDFTWPALSVHAFDWRNFFTALLRAPGTAWASAQHALGVSTLFISFPVFAAAGLWIVSPGRSFAAYLKRRRVDFRPELLRLLVSSTRSNPFRGRDVYREIHFLRRPRLLDSTELDVEASLDSTLNQAGLFTPVLARRPVAPEHLFVIERRSENDHVARLAEQLVRVLRDAQVYVEVYWFASDVRRLSRSEDAPASTFEEVAARHFGYRLVLVTSGESFFDPASGALQNWVHLVRSFDRRILMTPTPRELWGYREETLQTGLQTPVLLLHPNSLPEAVMMLTGGEAARIRASSRAPSAGAPALAHMIDLLEERPVRWTEAWIPEKQQQEQVVTALRDGLEPQKHALLAACAVYPELYWNLTLHLGNALSSAGGSDGLASRILGLANLPWFRAGRMPIWLRQKLTAGMSTDLYNQVRRILRGLLLTAFGQANRNLAFEIGLKRGTEGFRGAAEHLSMQMEDPVLIDFMTGYRRDRTSVRLPRMLARLISGGTLRNVFSNDQIKDLDEAAGVIRSWVSEQNVVDLEVTDPANELGAEFRVVTNVIDESGVGFALTDPLYLYLPVGQKPARLIDEPVVAVYYHRRKSAWLLSFLNIGVVLFMAAVFYNDYYETTTHGVAIAFLWLVVPPILLYLLLVRPVTRRFSSFPAFAPHSQPRHLSSCFRSLLSSSDRSSESPQPLSTAHD